MSLRHNDADVCLVKTFCRDRDSCAEEKRRLLPPESGPKSRISPLADTRRRNMFDASRRFLLFDVICLILVGLPFAILTPRHNPFKRGFFCNDEDIKYPFKDDTISYQLLGGVMIPFSLIVIGCGEFLSVYFSRVKHQPLGKKYLFCLYKCVGSYLFGAAANQSLTDIAKYTIGRLRPHFLSVCKPVWEKINCKEGRYIENFTCTGDEFTVTEARVSFFSGHSSFSMFCMLFLTLYIQARLRAKWSRLLRPSFQFFLIATAVYVGLTRVSDYKHHWSDVLAGLLCGGLVAVFTVFCVSNFFSQPDEPVVSQAEEDLETTRTGLQENPPNENNYCSTG